MNNTKTRMIFASAISALLIGSDSSSCSKICSEANQSGQCQNISVGIYNRLSTRTFSDGSPANNTISSISVKSGESMTLCDGVNFSGICASYRVPQTSVSSLEVNLPSYINDAASSVQVSSYHTGWTDYTQHCEPCGLEGAWSNEAQGIAHDAHYWYFSNRRGVWAYGFDENLGSTSSRRGKIVAIPSGCTNDDGHIGDIDVHDGRLYIPIHDCSSEPKTRLVVYNLDDGFASHYRTFALPSSKRMGWVAVHPTTGQIFTAPKFKPDNSDDDVDLDVYDGNIDALPNGASLPFLYSVNLPSDLFIGDETYTGLQGGAFAPSGNIYLAFNRYHDAATTAGIIALRVMGRHAFYLRTIRSSSLISVPSWFDPNPNFWLDWDEVEGVDILTDPESPGTSGQVHYVILQNEPKDDVYVEHATVNIPDGL